jgi:elongation factor Ts
MAEISAKLVKELRDRTGAGMMECKKALQEANGDLAEAEVILRKRGIAAAAKKASRATKQGLIGSYQSEDGKLAVLVEVNCESDFVARNEDFQAFVGSLAAHIANNGPYPEGDGAVPHLLSQTFGEEGLTVEQVLANSIAKIGENQAIARLARYSAGEAGGTAEGSLGIYIHPGAQLGVVVEVSATKAETAAKTEFQDLLKDLAMQIAAADPQFISRDDVDQSTLDKEREIQRDRALAEGKPEKMVDRIVEGRMSKFYEEICLLEQPFVKENSLSIGQLVAQKASSLGDELQVVRFSRFKVGDTAPQEETTEE